MMSMPPGAPPPQPPSLPPDDDFRDADRRSGEVDADAAPAEALGYADTEDDPITTDGDAVAEDSSDEDSSQMPDIDGPGLRDAELTKAEEAEHPRPTTTPEANPYRPT